MTHLFRKLAFSSSSGATPFVRRGVPLWVAAAGCALFLTGSGFADLLVEGELSEVSTEFEDGTGFMAIFKSTTSHLKVPVSTRPRFVFDFSAIGDETLVFRFKAPAGKIIQIAPPEGFENSFFQLACSFGTSGTNGGISPDLEIVFEGLEGSPASFMKTSLLHNGGDVGQFSASSNLSGAVRFKAVEVRLPIPESFNNSFDVDMKEFEIFGFASASLASEVTDPGPWITLIEDPAITLQRLDLKRQLKKVVRKLKRAKMKNDRKAIKKLLREKRKIKIRLRDLG